MEGSRLAEDWRVRKVTKVTNAKNRRSSRREAWTSYRSRGISKISDDLLRGGGPGGDRPMPTARYHVCREVCFRRVIAEHQEIGDVTLAALQVLQEGVPGPV